MWNCLRDDREIADVSEEPTTKRKRIDTSLDVGEGQPVHDKPIFRAHLGHVKTDHFVDFISRLCFLQDVADCMRHPKTETRQWSDKL